MRKAGLYAVLLFLAGIAPAHALRCGNALVVEGDYQYDVLRKCGEPAAVNEWVVYRAISLVPPDVPLRQDVIVPVMVEEWIYDLGPQRFIRVLRFENGRLRGIETGRYGN